MRTLEPFLAAALDTGRFREAVGSMMTVWPPTAEAGMQVDEEEEGRGCAAAGAADEAQAEEAGDVEEEEMGEACELARPASIGEVTMEKGLPAAAAGAPLEPLRRRLFCGCCNVGQLCMTCDAGMRTMVARALLLEASAVASSSAAAALLVAPEAPADARASL